MCLQIRLCKVHSHHWTAPGKPWWRSPLSRFQRPDKTTSVILHENPPSNLMKTQFALSGCMKCLDPVWQGWIQEAWLGGEPARGSVWRANTPFLWRQSLRKKGFFYLKWCAWCILSGILYVPFTKKCWAFQVSIWSGASAAKIFCSPL